MISECLEIFEASVMTLHASEAALLGPAAVAVNNDGDVGGDFYKIAVNSSGVFVFHVCIMPYYVLLRKSAEIARTGDDVPKEELFLRAIEIEIHEADGVDFIIVENVDRLADGMAELLASESMDSDAIIAEHLAVFEPVVDETECFVV